MERPIRRGDIYLADLSPVTGSEQGGVRPVLIIQNNTGNRFAPTVIVAAITTSTIKKAMPTHVKLESGRHGVEEDSTVLLEQLRTIDKNRLDNFCATISHDKLKMKEINDALMISVMMDDLPRKELVTA
jgi:mRNA interferase MazF